MTHPPAADPVPADRARRLRPGHIEVLRHCAAGRTNAQVATRMGLSPNTVTDYWKVIRARLGVGTAPQAVAVAYALGLLRVEDIEVPPSAEAAAAGGAR